MWLILTGIIPKPFTDTSEFVVIDPFGNQLVLPTNAMVSIVFSILSILKTSVHLNVVGIHIKVNRR